ncbi:MAG: phytoene/squalene synthase family protein [Bacteroidota bacterium]
MARGHYENFPVASLLMPRRLRRHIAAVYAFARHADDIADEGNASAEERREALEQWRAQLVDCMEIEIGQMNPTGASGESANGSVPQTNGSGPQTNGSDPQASRSVPQANSSATRCRSGEDNRLQHPVFVALGDTMRRFRIPVQLFHDLLDAFVQDTHKQDYADFDELLDYCRRSADPVGRIILSLFDCLDERTGPASDALCTGLQLVNFWQDVSVDRRKPRLYIPLADLLRFELCPDDILHGEDTHATKAVIAFEVERTRELFIRSIPLFALVPTRLRLELNAIWRGGMRVLELIEKQSYTVIQSRPALSATDMLSVFSGAVLKGIPHAGS